jgi:hypothetical protein
MSWRAAIALLLVCWLYAPANAQTTKPSEAWVGVVHQFANSLSDPNGADDSKATLSDDCAVRSFKDSGNTVATLAAHLSGANLLLANAYTAPVTTLASDVANSIGTSRNLPDSVRKMFIPADGDASKADSVAALWMSRVLNLTDGQSAGVLIYLVADPIHPDSSQPQAILVLIKGQADLDGAYHVTQIVFGDPQQAVAAYH